MLFTLCAVWLGLFRLGLVVSSYVCLCKVCQVRSVYLRLFHFIKLGQVWSCEDRLSQVRQC
jgi:hypothetical protein